MKTTTLQTSTWNGTTRPLAPATRRRTIGANSTSMIRSLTETWTRVYAGSPSVRYDQTNTMAVQGAAARTDDDAGDVLVGERRPDHTAGTGA